MKEFSSFDIIGPVMIGPSSSHTAGAARLGKIAGIIAKSDGVDIKSVKFLLHGSFSKTYKGHGTDRALVAGILGMDPWDERLRDSLKIAEETGLKVEIVESDLGNEHPNTVKFIIEKADSTITEIKGSSVGGGNIVVTELNGQEVEFTGAYPTLVISHKDVPGMISKISTLIYWHEINVAFLKVYRSFKGSSAVMVFETDTIVPEDVIDQIKKTVNVLHVAAIHPI